MVAALALLPLILTPALPPQVDVAAELLGDVEEIVSPGVPGSVCVFGADAHVVVADANGIPVVAAVDPPEAGRIVAFGHGGYLGNEARGHDGTARLLEAAEAWASRGGSVKVVVAGGERSDEDWRRLAERVRGGTGLVVAATGWGWRQLNPGKDIAVDLPANALLVEHGLAFGTETTRDSGSTGFLTTAPPEAAHAGRALAALVAGTLAKDDARLAEARLLEALGCLPTDEPILVAPLTAYLDARASEWDEHGPRIDGDIADRLAVRLLHDRWERLAPEAIPISPTAASFPGAVAEGAVPVVREIAVGAERGWHSTGLYAPPGTVVEATHLGGPLPPGIELRIGCHTDRLWSKDTWRRWPEISRSTPVTNGLARLASPHGGLVYVVRDQAWRGDGDEDPLTLEIRGAIQAAEAGPAGSRAAPWGEIEGEHVVLALPRDVLASVADPKEVAAYWDAVWEAQVELLGEPISDRKERLVADVQISAGYMHAGYPIMTHLDGAEFAVDLEKLRREGSWGHFHELGHNAQRPAWTFAGTGEVTCNLFTLYTMEKVVGIPTQEHPRVVENRERAAAHRASGADFERWKREPFLALAMYTELQAEFGWEPFTAVFEEYAALPAGQRPRGDAEERDQWCARMSRRVGRNLGKFFENWGVPVRADVVEGLGDLPAWEGPR